MAPPLHPWSERNNHTAHNVKPVNATRKEKRKEKRRRLKWPHMIRGQTEPQSHTRWEFTQFGARLRENEGRCSATHGIALGLKGW